MPRLDAALDELSISKLLPVLCTIFGVGVVPKYARFMFHEGDIRRGRAGELL
jgi:hypothetical protein